jgi:hypothetical protein
MDRDKPLTETKHLADYWLAQEKRARERALRGLLQTRRAHTHRS